jgi:hypothetical protein
MPIITATWKVDGERICSKASQVKSVTLYLKNKLKVKGVGI